MAKATQKMRTLFTSRIDLDEQSREKLVGLLNQQLADTFDLYSQTKQAHWNVKNMQFYQLHELFDELAEQLHEHVDMIAERATALGGVAMGTARIAARTSRIEEYPLDTVDSLQHVEALALRFASYAATTRAAIDQAIRWDDQGSADLFTDISRGMDKALWFLEAHLQT
jgi:starvation-inducible DNA-binding protein